MRNCTKLHQITSLGSAVGSLCIGGSVQAIALAGCPRFTRHTNDADARVAEMRRGTQDQVMIAQHPLLSLCLVVTMLFLHLNTACHSTVYCNG